MGQDTEGVDVATTIERLAHDDHAEDVIRGDVVLVDHAHDAAVVHDRDAVREVEHVVDVVADQEDADALAGELADQQEEE